MAATLTTLALLYLAALIIPGPNLLLLTHTAASASRRAALGVALGISTGTVMWVAVAVFGVQQIFEAAPALQTALRAVGGVYLLYLAWGLFGSIRQRDQGSPADRSRDRDDRQAATDEAATPPAASSRATFYRRGLLTNLTNPKSMAFWTSVAVVSLDPQATLATRLAAVAMVGCMGLVYHLSLAWLFSTAPAQQAYLRAKPVLSAITGAIMTAFGVRLLWSLRG
ncbi:MAG TPA: LysE family transporter [Casimicrobium huifangae]|jgi:threonine/homoserine/homoserine lactone efflux protein|uniref:Threonine efflux protein n=1 Tax=uncultured bacterium A1Q1_fos_36 TaxID=1256573 RepID=L7VX80_9BACT|nr:LysE family transporter [Casimicrobium huifangae]AGC72006.1 threonine efflux protein [uncultured bacterium A1Q1_fos_36]HOB01702.1 LysE family transporter [Casimicrobium huifangae]HQA33085.1 LysE family transporter [Casimicrobium huifangae]HQD64676.1 LysE family transporter [Casimicrobium huifangae]